MSIESPTVGLGPVLKDSLEEIYLFDGQTLRFFEASRGALANVGYTLGELRQLTALQLQPRLSPVAFAELVEPLRQAVEPKRSYRTMHRRKDGSIYSVDVHLQLVERSGPMFVAICHPVSPADGGAAEEELRESAASQTRMWYLQALERVNGAITRARQVASMLNEILDILLEELKCDRISLTRHPDPQSQTLDFVVQRAVAAYPGSVELGMQVPLSEDLRRWFESSAQSQGLQEYHGDQLARLFGTELLGQYPVRSMICLCLRPKTGRPWMVAFKHCSHDRPWTDVQKHLIQEVTRRMEDALATMLTLDDLKRSQKLLEVGEQRARVGTWELDPESNTGMWSKQMFRLFDRDPEEEAPSPSALLEKVHPDDREHLVTVSQAVKRGQQESGLVEFRTIGADGSVRYMAATILREVRNGKIIMTGATQDVTQLMRRELALRESEMQLKLFIEHAPAPLAMFDRQMRYLCCSRRWREGFGLGDANLVDQSHYEIFPRIPQRWKDAHERALAGEVVTADCDRFIRADGTETWRRWEVRPWQTAEGNVGGIVVFTEDITSIVELNRDLEMKVEQRTAEVRRSNRELEEFAHSVSHDLRAPLRAMEGFARALQEDYGAVLEDEASEYVQHIVDSATRMEVLIDDLLSYSRLGRGTLQTKAIPLGDVLGEVQSVLQQEIEAQQATIEVVHPLPVVDGHWWTLMQIFTNLIANALKFVSPHVRPSIRVWHSEKNLDRIVMYVEDNGIGIEPAYQERIFKIFERLHGIERYQGTGIGLAIVSRGCERHGGSCGVESALNQGSRFWVELPKYRGSSCPPHTPRC